MKKPDEVCGWKKKGIDRKKQQLPEEFSELLLKQKEQKKINMSLFDI